MIHENQHKTMHAKGNRSSRCRVLQLMALGFTLLSAGTPVLAQGAAAQASAPGHRAVLKALVAGAGPNAMKGLSQARQYATMLDNETLIALLGVPRSSASDAAMAGLVAARVLTRRLAAGDMTDIVEQLQQDLAPLAMRSLLHVARSGLAGVSPQDHGDLVDRCAAILDNPQWPDDTRIAAMQLSRTIMQLDFNGPLGTGEVAAACMEQLRSLCMDGAVSDRLRSSAVRELSIRPTAATPGDLLRTLAKARADGAPRTQAAACSGLADLQQETAIAAITTILNETNDPRLAGSAAVAIARMQSVDGLIALIQFGQWRETAICRLAVGMSGDVVLSLLSEPSQPGWREAVLATDVFYREANCRQAIDLLLPELTAAVGDLEVHEAILRLVARRGTASDCRNALAQRPAGAVETPAERSVRFRLQRCLGGGK